MPRCDPAEKKEMQEKTKRSAVDAKCKAIRGYL